MVQAEVFGENQSFAERWGCGLVSLFLGCDQGTAGTARSAR